MLLLLEISLTIWACIRMSKSGKSWAYGLLPVGITAAIAFIIGFCVTLAHGNTSAVSAIYLLLDLSTVGALIGMIIAAKPKAKI